MRKIDTIADERFDGNTEAALDFLIKNKDETFPQVIRELDKNEATFAFRKLHEYHADKIIDEEFGGKEKFADDVMLEMKLDEIGMTKEAVASSVKNPFRDGLIKAVAGLALSVIVPLLIYMAAGMTGNAEVMFCIQGGLIAFFAFKVTESIMKCLKFRNVKKKIKQSEDL